MVNSKFSFQTKENRYSQKRMKKYLLKNVCLINQRFLIERNLLERKFEYIKTEDNKNSNVKCRGAYFLSAYIKF